MTLLQRSGSNSQPIDVHEDHADYWRGLGFIDVEGDEKPAVRKAASKKPAATKAAAKKSATSDPK